MNKSIGRLLMPAIQLAIPRPLVRRNRAPQWCRCLTASSAAGLLVAWLVLAAFDGAVAVETGDDALPAAGVHAAGTAHTSFASALPIPADVTPAPRARL